MANIWQERSDTGKGATLQSDAEESPRSLQPQVASGRPVPAGKHVLTETGHPNFQYFFYLEYWYRQYFQYFSGIVSGQ